jgi:hypothetical protein
MGGVIGACFFELQIAGNAPHFARQPSHNKKMNLDVFLPAVYHD